MLSLIVLALFFAMTFGLIWFFIKSDRGSKEPAGALFGAFGYGFLAIILAVMAESWFIPHAWLTTNSISGKAFWGFLLVGIIEELCKFGPLAAHIYRRAYFNEVTDGILYFGISGLAFGLFENISYLIGDGSQAGLFRIVVLMFFHGASSGIAGYYLIRAKLAGKSPWGRAMVALISLMLIHGVYDFAVSSASILILLGLLITLALNIALFVFWQRSKELDATYGLSAVGANNYCPNCGKPNPKHDMYCPSCGAKT